MSEEQKQRADKKAGKKRKLTAAVPQKSDSSAEQSADGEPITVKTEDNDDTKLLAKVKVSKHELMMAGPSRSAKTTKTSTDSVLTDKAKGDYSVAKDPNASETYKSIFTTHKTAKNQTKAHWVTYNPLYF